MTRWRPSIRRRSASRMLPASQADRRADRRYEVQRKPSRSHCTREAGRFYQGAHAGRTEVYTARSRICRARGLAGALAGWNQKAGRSASTTILQFRLQPEMSFFEQLLGALKLCPAEVEDVYFTGALTDRARPISTSNTWARTSVGTATPGFHRSPQGRQVLIVEIKDARFKAATSRILRMTPRALRRPRPKGARPCP